MLSDSDAQDSKIKCLTLIWGEIARAHVTGPKDVRVDWHCSNCNSQKAPDILPGTRTQSWKQHWDILLAGLVALPPGGFGKDMQGYIKLSDHVK